MLEELYVIIIFVLCVVILCLFFINLSKKREIKADRQKIYQLSKKMSAYQIKLSDLEDALEAKQKEFSLRMNMKTDDQDGFCVKTEPKVSTEETTSEKIPDSALKGGLLDPYGTADSFNEPEKDYDSFCQKKFTWKNIFKQILLYSAFYFLFSILNEIVGYLIDIKLGVVFLYLIAYFTTKVTYKKIEDRHAMRKISNQKTKKNHWRNAGINEKIHASKERIKRRHSSFNPQTKAANTVKNKMKEKSETEFVYDTEATTKLKKKNIFSNNKKIIFISIISTVIVILSAFFMQYNRLPGKAKNELGIYLADNLFHYSSMNNTSYSIKQNRKGFKVIIGGNVKRTNGDRATLYAEIQFNYFMSNPYIARIKLNDKNFL